MSLGLFVEGQSDRDTIPILARKIGFRRAIRCRVVERGSMLSADRMTPHVRSLSKQHPDLTDILICMDGDEFTPDQLRRRVIQPARQLNRVSSVQVNYIIVDRALEGWLACDEGALRAVLGSRARISIKSHPEHHPRPAEILRRLFRENGRTFVKTRHDPQIADQVTSSVVARRSPTFTEFSRTIRRLDSAGS